MIVNGEEYPYETMELNHDNNQKDMAGNFRFLQASETEQYGSAQRMGSRQELYFVHV